MKNNKREDLAQKETDLENNSLLFAIVPDEQDDDENDSEEESGDWGDVDPAGGDAPTSPGSAV